ADTPSVLLEFSYIYRGRTFQERDIRRNGPVMEVGRQGDLKLEPGEELVVLCEWQKTKAANDVHAMYYGFPTVRPAVTAINYCPNIQTLMFFGHRSGIQQLDRNDFRLPGTLLPQQSFGLRWWTIGSVHLLPQPSTQEDQGNPTAPDI